MCDISGHVKLENTNTKRFKKTPKKYRYFIKMFAFLLNYIIH